MSSDALAGQETGCFVSQSRSRWLDRKKGHPGGQRGCMWSSEMVAAIAMHISDPASATDDPNTSEICVFPRAAIVEGAMTQLGIRHFSRSRCLVPLSQRLVASWEIEWSGVPLEAPKGCNPSPTVIAGVGRGV